MTTIANQSSFSQIKPIHLKDFYKSSIVIFVCISAIAGYFVALPFYAEFSWFHFISSVGAITLLSAGSLGLNQVQEWRRDSEMDRTKSRPIPSGIFSPKMGLVIALIPLALGSIMLFQINLPAFVIGLSIVILYNIFYTYFFKPKLWFGAVPGAVPGAMPAILGYSTLEGEFLTSEAIYLFLVMFLWQMPHYWTLAIKLKDDYKKASFPILPVMIGTERTVFHIAGYLICYCALALLSPFFIDTDYVYFILVIPMALLLLYEFFRFAMAEDKQKSWLRFFLLTNFSLLLFLFAPVIDRWMSWWLYKASLL